MLPDEILNLTEKAYFKRSISIDECFEETSKKLYIHFVNSFFEEVMLSKNVRKTNNFIAFIFMNKLSNECFDVLLKFLLVDSHTLHEDILNHAQSIKKEIAIPYLNELIKCDFDSSPISGNIDDYYAAIRKSFFALGDIKSNEAIKIIRSYLNHNDPKVNEFAVEQMNRIEGSL